MCGSLVYEIGGCCRDCGYKHVQHILLPSKHYIGAELRLITEVKIAQPLLGNAALIFGREIGASGASSASSSRIINPPLIRGYGWM